MLKTNSRKAIDNVRKYIVDNVNSSNYDNQDVSTFENAARFIWSCFISEYGYAANIRYYGNYQNAFISWLAGLPSCIDTLYYYNRSAVDDIGKILDETETEKARYSEQEAEKLLSYLIFREVSKQARKDGVFPY